MKLLLKVTALILATSMLQGCSGNMNKQTSGTLIGGVAGGLLGSRFGKGSGALLATGAGALAGALIGGQIGQTMDDYDRQLLAQTSHNALENAPVGTAVPWKNPDNGHSGSVTPTKTYTHGNGQYCREYTQTVVIGGKQEKAYGTACRKPDGQWEVMQ